MYFVLQQKNETKKDELVLVEEFIPQNVNAFGVFTYQDLKQEATKELTEIDGWFAISLGINKFESDYFSTIKKDSLCSFSHFSDQNGKYGIFVGYLLDSLADMQQSGFVVKDATLNHRIITGQYKNLFLAVCAMDSMNMTLAASRCDAFIKSNKRPKIDCQPNHFTGKIVEQDSIFKDNKLSDSIYFEIDFSKNEMILLPFFDGLTNSSLIKEVGAPISFNSDSLRNEVNLNVHPKPFLSIIKKLKKVEKLTSLIQKTGIDQDLLESSWNGKLVYQDLGVKQITNTYIEYEMDDEFNTIEVKKETKKDVKAFAVAIGIADSNKYEVYNDLLNHKLIKEHGDHYQLLQVMDSEIFLLEEDNYFVITNLPEVKMTKTTPPNSSIISGEAFNRRFHLTWSAKELLIQY